jgi:hypothetical protein
VLERGRELLLQLRELADDFAPEIMRPGASEFGRPGAAEIERPETPEIEFKPAPLTPYYRSTLAMIDTALRTVSLLPDSVAAQLHLCHGLEETMAVVTERLRVLGANRSRRRHEHDNVDRLSEGLSLLASGRTVEIDRFRLLAEALLAEVAACEPLQFVEGDARNPAHFVACHGLTVARVVARVVSNEPSLHDRAADAVLAALLHDVGMVQMPITLLNEPGTLTDEQRRLVESHCRLGAELLAPLLPDEKWLPDVAEHHHERLDGTGYPDGLREPRIEPLTRLIAVCDVYAALCTSRPYRQARSSRTALADTLLQAEKGELDSRCAELLLPLSFYPVGSMVELAHGERGVVVATPVAGTPLDTPARPVVALLTDAHGEPLPKARHVDLARSGYKIVRSLSAEERCDLEQLFPEWAA